MLRMSLNDGSRQRISSRRRSQNSKPFTGGPTGTNKILKILLTPYGPRLGFHALKQLFCANELLEEMSVFLPCRKSEDYSSANMIDLIECSLSCQSMKQISVLMYSRCSTEQEAIFCDEEWDSRVASRALADKCVPIRNKNISVRIDEIFYQSSSVVDNVRTT